MVIGGCVPHRRLQVYIPTLTNEILEHAPEIKMFLGTHRLRVLDLDHLRSCLLRTGTLSKTDSQRPARSWLQTFAFLLVRFQHRLRIEFQLEELALVIHAPTGRLSMNPWTCILPQDGAEISVCHLRSISCHMSHMSSISFVTTQNWQTSGFGMHTSMDLSRMTTLTSCGTIAL